MAQEGTSGSILLKGPKRISKFLHIQAKMNTKKEVNADVCVLPLNAAPLNVQSHEPVIFLAHSNNRRDVENLKELLSRLKTQRPHVIYISSLAIYSSYVSTYAEIKSEFENQIKTFDQFSIIRLGFVHGRNFGGISSIFSALADQRLLILPSDKVKTGFIPISQACDDILRAAKNCPSCGVEDHYVSFLSMRRALELFGFRGASISVPLPYFQFLLRFAQFLRPITPHYFQSFLSVQFLNDKDFHRNITSSYMRCFLLLDYARLFGRLDVWQLRKYIREIEQNNTLSQYLSLKKKERFLFLYRLKEMMQIERDQK